MCIHKPPLLFCIFFYICFLFLQKVHILAGHRGSRREKEKVHTLGGHQERNRIRQKVHTLGSPRFALFHMHTRLSRLCGRLRKSAYTSRTPGTSPQPPKSAYTRQPAVCFILYAYYPDTIRQKVHTLAGHPPAVLTAKSMHTRLSPNRFSCCRHKVYTQASPQAGRRRHHTPAA